jgi:hypothetical protein
MWAVLQAFSSGLREGSQSFAMATNVISSSFPRKARRGSSHTLSRPRF